MHYLSVIVSMTNTVFYSMDIFLLIRAEFIIYNIHYALLFAKMHKGIFISLRI
jgi:hypothetical protein